MLTIPPNRKGKKSTRQRENVAQAAAGKRKHLTKEQKKQKAVHESRRDASSIDSDPVYLSTYLHSTDPNATDFEAWKVEDWFMRKRRDSIGGGMLDVWFRDRTISASANRCLTGALTDLDGSGGWKTTSCRQREATPLPVNFPAA
jgi:hypothetical protein